MLCYHQENKFMESKLFIRIDQRYLIELSLFAPSSITKLKK